MGSCSAGFRPANGEEQRGSRPVENSLPADALREASNNLDAPHHVQRGITGYNVVGQLETDALIIKHGLHGDICKVPEPVVSTALSHSLNSKHASLALRVEQVLRGMAERGEIERIWAVERQRAQKALVAAP